jgi:hypothetical protein
MQAETPVCRHVNCPLLLSGLLIFYFWCLLHVSKLWVQLQEDGCRNRYGIVCCTCIRQESVFHTQFCTYKTAYTSSWAWFTEITVVFVCWSGGVVLRTLCDVTYRNFLQWIVHLIPKQVTCFGMSKRLVLIPSFFRVFLFYFAVFFCPSCTILRHPSTPTPNPPPSTDLGTVYLHLPFIMIKISFSDNWL